MALLPRVAEATPCVRWGRPHQRRQQGRSESADLLFRGDPGGGVQFAQRRTGHVDGPDVVERSVERRRRPHPDDGIDSRIRTDRDDGTGCGETALPQSGGPDQRTGQWEAGRDTWPPRREVRGGRGIWPTPRPAGRRPAVAADGGPDRASARGPRHDRAAVISAGERSACRSQCTSSPTSASSTPSDLTAWSTTSAASPKRPSDASASPRMAATTCGPYSMPSSSRPRLGIRARSASPSSVSPMASRVLPSAMSAATWLRDSRRSSFSRESASSKRPIRPRMYTKLLTAKRRVIASAAESAASERRATASSLCPADSSARPRFISA